MNLDPYYIPYTKANYKGIIDLKLRAKTIILYNKIIGENLCEHGLHKNFLNRTLKTMNYERKKLG